VGLKLNKMNMVIIAVLHSLTRESSTR